MRLIKILFILHCLIFFLVKYIYWQLARCKATPPPPPTLSHCRSLNFWVFIFPRFDCKEKQWRWCHHTFMDSTAFNCTSIISGNTKAVTLWGYCVMFQQKNSSSPDEVLEFEHFHPWVPHRILRPSKKISISFSSQDRLSFQSSEGAIWLRMRLLMYRFIRWLKHCMT